MSELLDCGHKPSPHNDFTTGYGVDDKGKKSCYDCCLKWEKEQMRKYGNVMAYHSRMKTGGPGTYEPHAVTLWPGNVISDQVHILSHLTDNFGGERTYLRFVFEGEIWSGFSMGEGTYLRAKRTKLTSLYN
jgi:hypothetical protein